MDTEDKVIVCGDCGKEFTHTVEDQKRYAERGFTEDPKRCRECRQLRKNKAQSAPKPQRAPGRAGAGPRGGGGGGRFHDGPRGGGDFSGQRRSYGSGPPRERGGGGGGGGRGGGQRQIYQAVCSACGASTTVPFQPTPGREVFAGPAWKECGRRRRALSRNPSPRPARTETGVGGGAARTP